MRQEFDSDDGSPPPTHLSPKAVLRHNYLFRGLSDATLDGVAALAVKRTYYKGSVIFSQGDRGDALFGVASGRVRISASASGGREVFLNIMEPGDTFGEIAVMDGRPRTANAVALDTASLLVIQRTDFLPFLEREPRLALHLLKLMCERLRWTSELVEESAFMAGPARLAKRLLILATLHGRAARVGQLELRISQAELARFLGISRQIVNQHLSDWRRLGWVEVGRTQIIIRDTDALRALIAEASASAGH
jgi:CRP/FNR family cyclic AMP-dependent transcriptional regulator